MTGKLINLPRCKVKDDLVHFQAEHVATTGRATAIRTSGIGAYDAEVKELPRGTKYHVIERNEEAYLQLRKKSWGNPYVDVHCGDVERWAPILAKTAETTTLWVDADTTGTYGKNLPATGSSKQQRMVHQVIKSCPDVVENLFFTFTFCERCESAAEKRDQFLYKWMPAVAKDYGIPMPTMEVDFYNGTNGARMVTSFYHLEFR